MKKLILVLLAGLILPSLVSAACGELRKERILFAVGGRVYVVENALPIFNSNETYFALFHAGYVVLKGGTAKIVFDADNAWADGKVYALDRCGNASPGVVEWKNMPYTDEEWRKIREAADGRSEIVSQQVSRVRIVISPEAIKVMMANGIRLRGDRMLFARDSKNAELDLYDRDSNVRIEIVVAKKSGTITIVAYEKAGSVVEVNIENGVLDPVMRKR